MDAQGGTGPAGGSTDGPDAPSHCRRCGRAAEEPAAVLTWTLEVSDGRAVWTCPQCSRDHLPDIEARLDVETWR